MLFSSGMAAATSVFHGARARRPHHRPDGDVLGAAQLARDRRQALGARRRASSTRATSTPSRPRSGPARRSSSGSRRRPTRSGPSPTSPRSSTIAHAAGAKVAVDSTVATPVFTRPLDPRRRHRHARGDEGAQRPFRRQSPARSPARETTRSGQRIASIREESRRHPRPVRGLSADARHAHARPARAHALQPPPRHWRSASSPIPMSHRCSYPGLKAHPGHDDRRQADDRRLRPHAVDPCARQAKRARSPPRRGVTLWKRATSLGGVESLIEHRASIEGPGTPCPPDLLRLSAGIEDPEDLFIDLDQALRRAHASSHAA